METGAFCYPQDLANGDCQVDSPFITMGRPLMWVYSVWGKIFGEGMGVARWCTLMFTLLGFWVFFEMVRHFFSSAKAFWACFILIGNIQILSYGTQVLGEMPMMAFLLAGLYFHLRWHASGKLGWALAAPLAWLGAVLCKAYLAVPLALALGIWWLVALIRKEKPWGIFMQACLLGVGGVLYLFIEQGSWQGLQNYFEARSSYGNEFLTFGDGESFRFLLFKPLIALGMIALAIRIYFQRLSRDIFLAVIQGALTVFFILSEGYDRFGMLLLFIPAVYLSEFIAAAWNRIKGRLPYQLGFSLLFLVFFVQQTPYIFYKDWPGRVAKEESWRASLHTLTNSAPIITYDQHYAWILGGSYRLADVVPSNKVNCESLLLNPGELFLAGPYAKTEYQNCIPWSKLQIVGEVGEYGYPFTLYKMPYQEN